MIAQALVFLADAAPAPPAGSPFNQLFFLVPMVVIFYVLLIRPQQTKQKELQKMISNLKTGDKVVTNGGIHGIVTNVKDGPTLVLKVADNVKIEVDKSAISSVDRGSASAEPIATPAVRS